MKKFISLLIIISLSLSFVSCNSKKTNSYSNVNNKIMYSNIIDNDSKLLLESALKEASINKNYIDTAMRLINDYNEHMTSFNKADEEYMEEKDLFPFQKGFTISENGYVNYGDYYFQMKKWYSNRDYEDAYCRTLAFLLMQDFINVSSPLTKEKWGISNEDDFLFGDYNALNNYKLIDINKAQYPAYFTLFHPVLDINKNKNFGNQIIEQWKNYGISFNKGKASLITIWSVINDNNNSQIQHSHAGVLIETKDGLLFVEKTNPLAPYQITKFNSVEQIKTYMITSLIAYFDSLKLPVNEMIVLKNDSIL